MPEQEAKMLRIKVFGPGVGESIVVGVGDDFWFTVDSCIDSRTNTVPALGFLEELGVDIGKSLEYVIATHWHDDHIRGISQLVSRGTSARFVSSTLLTDKSIEQLLAIYRTSGRISRSGLFELSSILDTLRTRRGPRPVLAMQNKVLFSRMIEIEGRSCKVQLLALSPSDKSIQREVENLLGHMPTPGSKVVPIASRGKNLASIGLVLSIDDFSVLLGADLENSADPEEGWLSVLDSRDVSLPMSDIFKVSHHGSVTGHNSRIWSEALKEGPLCVLTPFVRGRRMIPTKEDLLRISSLTPHAYITSYVAPKKASRLNPSVARTLKEMGAEFTVSQIRVGSVEVSGRIVGLDSNGLEVQLSPTASKVSDLLESNGDAS
ncbi:MAG: MBL fold metallo-hydrolase [Spirochaetales bacterium]